MPDNRTDLTEFNRALAEHDFAQLADELGYGFGVLTDGTIICEPPADPEHCAICRGKHTDTVAGVIDAIDKHTRAYAAIAFGLHRPVDVIANTKPTIPDDYGPAH